MATTSLFYVSYLPRGVADRLDWLSSFNHTIPSYAAKFGITTEEVASVNSDFEALENARVTLANYTDTFKKSVTAYANELDTDATPNPLSQPIFNPPLVSPTIQSGIFARINNLVQTKIMPTANDTEKTALQLNPVDTPSTATATITAIEAMARGQVGLTMNRGGSKLTIIYSRRAGETTFTLLDKVADTHFLDTRPNAVAGIGEAREYQIEWSMDGKTGDGHLSPIASVVTLA